MSERNHIKNNVNGSKNTRMDLDHSAELMDYRCDEIMFLARYNLGAQTMIDLSKQLGRPIRVLDVGCGQMNTVRLFYKSFQVKKSDVIESYTGIDIDDVMIERCLMLYGSCYEKCNASYMLQDLTVDPHLIVEDDYYDLIICTEFLEHIDPTLSQPIIEELYRVMNPEGKALFSTPNSNGSNKVLPKDHFYEYSYEELIDKFQAANWEVEDTVGMSINISKIPKELVSQMDSVFSRFNSGFGRNSYFTRVAIAPLIDPQYCKNVLYICKKKEQ